MTAFLVTGRATDRNGSNIVRSDLVTQLTEDGHTVYSSVPDGYMSVDYLVTSNRSRNNRTLKYRWAENNRVEIITYPQMWRIARGETMTPRGQASQRVREDMHAVTREGIAESQRAAHDDYQRVVEAEVHGDAQDHEHQVYDCMESRDLSYSAAVAWINAEMAAGDAARAQAAAEMRNLRETRRSEHSHTIPIADVADSLANHRAREREESREIVKKEYARVKALAKPATAPRRRIFVRK